MYISENMRHPDFYIVTCIPIARQRVGKHIPLNNSTSIAGQRSCKHAFLTVEDGVFQEVRADEL
jgi:hypothetical protein